MQQGSAGRELAAHAEQAEGSTEPAERPAASPRAASGQAPASRVLDYGAAAAAAAVAHDDPEAGGLREPLLSPSKPDAAAASDRGGLPETPATKALVFGAINAVACVPALVAYCSIVFREPVFVPKLDLLCKLFFVSSAVHQATFCLMSKLPYAIGQVQDVGLIFLSAMASSVATLCVDAGKDAATALGTALLTMTTATFLVGVGTLLIARYKLASIVQYLPLSVIGGYLGYVGYFCIASGIGLGSSVEIGSIPRYGGGTSWRVHATEYNVLGLL